MAKALTVKQPRAWAIIEAGKDVENRSYRMHYRGTLFILPGLGVSKEGFEFLARHGLVPPAEPARGGIIGVVDLVDCVQGCGSIWAFPGEWHWVLENPRPVPFVPMKGQLSMFDVDLPVPRLKPRKR